MPKKTIDYITLKRELSTFNKLKITSSKMAADYIKQFYHDDLFIYESVFILLLNAANYTIGYAKISQGGISGTILDVRIVCKYAIDALATSVILAHNHPSGNLVASEADKQITKKTKEALKMFEVTLVDHVILTEYGHLSFSDEGLL